MENKAICLMHATYISSCIKILDDEALLPPKITGRYNYFPGFRIDEDPETSDYNNLIFMSVIEPDAIVNDIGDYMHMCFSKNLLLDRNDWFFNSGWNYGEPMKDALYPKDIDKISSPKGYGEVVFRDKVPLDRLLCIFYPKEFDPLIEPIKEKFKNIVPFYRLNKAFPRRNGAEKMYKKIAKKHHFVFDG